MSVLDEIAAERRRQIEVGGWTHQHDDRVHVKGEMAAAAGCYAMAASDPHGFWYSQYAPQPEEVQGPRSWPWHPRWWKPKNRRSDLIKAGALIVAEVERLDRAFPARANQPTLVLASDQE